MTLELNTQQAASLRNTVANQLIKFESDLICCQGNLKAAKQMSGQYGEDQVVYFKSLILELKGEIMYNEQILQLM